MEFDKHLQGNTRIKVKYLRVESNVITVKAHFSLPILFNFNFSYSRNCRQNKSDERNLLLIINLSDIQKRTRTQNFIEIDFTVLIAWEQSYCQTKLVTKGFV